MKKSLKIKKRKNPVDYQFLKEVGINVPIGLPDNTLEALQLGIMLGQKRIIELCDGVHYSKIKSLYKLHDIKQVSSQFFSDKSFNGNIPSDSFMKGIGMGLLSYKELCKNGSLHERNRTALYVEIVTNNLFQKYADLSEIKNDGVWYNIKSYFGVRKK